MSVCISPFLLPPHRPSVHSIALHPSSFCLSNRNKTINQFQLSTDWSILTLPIFLANSLPPSFVAVSDRSNDMCFVNGVYLHIFSYILMCETLTKFIRRGGSSSSFLSLYSLASHTFYIDWICFTNSLLACGIWPRHSRPHFIHVLLFGLLFSFPCCYRRIVYAAGPAISCSSLSLF